jgi:hypothetical protein
MGLVLVPIVPEKLESWKEWINEISTTKIDEFNDFNSRMNLSGHKVWLAQTPGGPMAVVSHEGPGGDEMMQKLAASDHPFDQWFMERVSEFHGMDFSQPPPGPMPEQMINWVG